MRSFLILLIVSLSGIALAEKGDKKKNSSKDDSHKFKYTVAGNLKYLSSTRTYKSDSGTSDPSTSTDIEINFNFLFRSNRFFYGPLIGYTSSTSEDLLGETRTNSTLDIGGLIDYTMDDVDRKKIVPHAYLGLRYNTELDESRSEDAATGYRIGLGIGLYCFLARGIAVNPAFEFQNQTLNFGGDTNASADTKIMGLLVGIAVFI